MTRLDFIKYSPKTIKDNRVSIVSLDGNKLGNSNKSTYCVYQKSPIKETMKLNMRNAMYNFGVIFDNFKNFIAVITIKININTCEIKP